MHDPPITDDAAPEDKANLRDIPKMLASWTYGGNNSDEIQAPQHPNDTFTAAFLSLEGRNPAVGNPAKKTGFLTSGKPAIIRLRREAL